LQTLEAAPRRITAVQRKSLKQDRCLYAGHRLAHKQVLSKLIAEQYHSPLSMSFEHFRHLNGSSRVFVFLLHT
jgi:hypothetical protein